MESHKIDKSIAQVRLSSMALILASFVILSISILFERGVAHRAAKDLLKIKSIQEQWSQTIPRPLTTMVSDITIGSEVFVASMGYVALHGSSPLSSISNKDQLFLSSEKHNAVVLDASSFQKNVLDDLQLLYSSRPLTLEHFRRSWNHLTFPIYFMQFHSIRNWYLGTPDENSIVWWKKVERNDYVPIVPNSAHPQEPVKLALSNRDSKWEIMGNMWRSEDSSSDMKSDLNNNDGWFLYAEYETNSKQHKLIGVLAKPVLKKVFPLNLLPLKFKPGHEVDLTSAKPFSIEFPWISEYEDRFGQASLEQLKVYLSIREEHEGKQVSLFGISVTQKQIVLFAVPILLVLQIHILFQMLSMIAYIKSSGSNKGGKYSDNEPLLMFSDSKVVSRYYLIAFYVTPAVSAAVSALVEYSREDQWLAMFPVILVFILSAMLIQKGILLRQLRFAALVTVMPDRPETTDI